MSRILREKRTHEVQVSRWCPERVYVELTVPEDIHAISRIVFRTDSHDQGYSGEPHWYGTYDGSYTWFVAAAISPGGHERSPRRVVQYNVHASAIFKRHEITWSADSEDVSAREWVQSIRGGDTVQIIPKAQWPGWVNFVREAEIEVHCGEFRAADVSPPQCYRPLDKSAAEVRLLCLNPGTSNDQISCSLIHTKLREHPTVPYEALSYCWGDSRERGEITVKALEGGVDLSCTMSVTLSLLSALKAIRPLTKPARVLWVDAICINQGDFDERSSQVALIRDIFRQAHRVVVWLGEGNPKTQKSIQIINTISDRYKQSKFAADSSEDTLTSLHAPLMKGDVYGFIEEWSLFELPWFHRTWVVQEIFNAKKSVFCCGSDTVTWESFLRVNKCIPLGGLTMKTATKALMPPIYNKLFDSKISQAKSMQSTKLEILDVLIQGLDLDATDPRDKLFAMLQFGSETWGFDSLPSTIMPDYNRPTREVFSLFTKWWIMEHQSLRILSAIQALEWRTWQETRWGTSSSKLPSVDLPSWSWGYRGHSNWAIGLLGLSRDNPYRASVDTVPDVQIIRQSSGFPLVLPLTGFKVGIIEKIEPYPYNRPRDSGYEDLHRAYVGIFDPLNLTGKWQYQLGSKFNQNYMDVKDPVEMAGHFQVHRDFSQRFGGFECHGRCFFRAYEGFVGLCPYAARPGDVIVVLYGGNVTYLLRSRAQYNGKFENAKEYDFVGECYAQGYMNGEGLEEQHKNAIPIEVFALS
ncbi:hypothetical protein O1611_g2628 [Lasiodiplodia mahajangana]|uniref:Uncharacterized protein n=1 Tax=Lasiodiplodia mahajangana TaxID=1108764 RepID=A0ACC2JTZ2_9PEZI|nr:hypothetical protein O1611_g2628 [Lasiodiplodia mahajangana]